MRCDERKFTENECAKFKNYEIEFHKIYWTMENWCFVWNMFMQICIEYNWKRVIWNTLCWPEAKERVNIAPKNLRNEKNNQFLSFVHGLNIVSYLSTKVFYIQNNNIKTLFKQIKKKRTNWKEKTFFINSMLRFIDGIFAAMKLNLNKSC